MKVIMVSTYPPRRDRVAKFAEELRGALQSHIDDVLVVSPTDGEGAGGDQALTRFRQFERGDYAPAAHRINASDADMVLIQHEFGIYGGPDGAYILDMTRALRVPYCVTLHTVLAHPSRGQADVTRELCAGAEMVFIFSPTARQLLSDSALVDPAKVVVMPHGAPHELIDRSSDCCVESRLSDLVGMDLYGRRVMSTFGLLSPAKGLEQAIEAIPAVMEVAPDIVYVVAGATDPEVVRESGETYRHGLEQLVAETGLEDHVVFLNRHLDDDELFTLLHASQVVITAYPEREQVVSGTLTYAIAAGCAVVSTPFYYAEDLARTGAVILTKFDDPRSLANGLARLLVNPAAMASARRASSALAEKLSWSAVGQQLAKRLQDAASRRMVTV